MDLSDTMANPPPLNMSYDESKLYQIADLMVKDEDLVIFKRFSELNFFNLLHIQHRLTVLEKDLCKNLQDRLSVNHIAVEIRQLLKDYNAAYLAILALKDAPMPIDMTLSRIEHYSDSHLRDFHRELGSFGKRPAQRLMSLTATDISWTRNFVDDHPFLQKMFVVKGLENATPGLKYLSDTGFRSVMAKIERLLITLGFCFLLLGPVYWLSYTKDMATKLGIVAGFVVCVSLLTASLTRAQYWEICTVTAGYSAILVVFLSSGFSSST